MKMKYSLLIIIWSNLIPTLLADLPGVSALIPKYRRVCYYTIWSQDLQGKGNFVPENVHPELCTHLIFAFAAVSGNTLSTIGPNDQDLVIRLNSLKGKAPGLKTLISVGGWEQGGTNFSKMAQARASRKTFIASAIIFLRKHSFNGLDLNWMYPGQRGGGLLDRKNFVLLLKEVKTAFEQESFITDRERLVLTAAVPAGKSDIDIGYNVTEIAKYLDFASIMTYDLHGPWDSTTGHNSPLYARLSETPFQKTLNVKWAADYWVSQGLPKDRINIGIPTYGRTFILRNPAHDIMMGAAVKGAGPPGKYTDTAGFLASYEICELMELENGRDIWHYEHKVPFFVVGDIWVGYEDRRSIYEKVKFIVEEGYGGVMVWSLPLDDFHKSCKSSRSPYPLTKTIKTFLNHVERGENLEDSLISTLPVNTDSSLSTRGKYLAAVDTSTALILSEQDISMPASTSKYRRVCYYTNWPQDLPGKGKRVPEDIPTQLCTHLIFAFAAISGNKLVTTKPDDIGLFKHFNDIKSRTPALKTLIFVGGWEQGGGNFSKMVQTRALRERFIKSVIVFLREHGFDGIDLNWKYPGQRGGRRKDKKNFVLLLKELKTDFERESAMTSRERLILTAVVPAGQSNIDIGYDVPEMTKYLDFISIETYNFHGPWENTSGHNSPLYERQAETSFEKTLNVKWAADYWVSKGLRKELINIGIPTFGRTFTLKNPISDYKMGAAVTGAGPPGKYTDTAGFLAYYEICDLLQDKNRRKMWHDEHKVPYVIVNDVFIGYEDSRSLFEKVKFIVEEGYGGAMVWSLPLDDFDLSCKSSQSPYPLTRTINTLLSRAERGENLEDNIISTLPIHAESLLTFITGEHVTTSALTTSSTLSSEASALTHRYRRVCYYTNWSHDHPGKGKFVPEDINPHLCTHVIFAFAAISGNALEKTRSNDEDLYERFNNLKSLAPGLKTLISVGGWDQGGTNFSRMAETTSSRRRFIKSVILFLRRYGFDGIDLNWEYPGQRGGGAMDKINFILLLQGLREAFNSESDDTGNERLILSAAVPAGQSDIDIGYDVPEIDKYLDFASIMAYDFHGLWDNTAEHNSPLYERLSKNSFQKTLNVKWAADYWVSKGLDKDRINIGIPTFGRTFTLKNPAYDIIIGAAVSGSGPPGKYSNSAGFLAYYEICDLLENENGREFWHHEHKVPYFVTKDTWIGYEDRRSIIEKTKFIVEEGYGGAMIWSLPLDDFAQSCKSSKSPYPLTRTINDLLHQAEVGLNLAYNLSTTLPAYTENSFSTTEDARVTSAITAVPTSSGVSVPKEKNEILPPHVKTRCRKYRLVCYYTNWSQYRPNIGKFLPENIPPQLCTHVIFAFADVVDNRLAPLESSDEDLYRRLNVLRNEAKDLNILISVGGWNAASHNFTRVTTTRSARSTFIQSTIDFLRRYKFDGLDINWEYPGQRGGGLSDKNNYVLLLKEMSHAFQSEAVKTSRRRLLLTASVPAGEYTILVGYDIPEIAKYVDFVSLMTYDLHGSWDMTTGHLSPLHPKANDNENLKKLTVDWASKYWVQGGMPRGSINLGIPTYGRTFTLTNPTSDTGLGAAASGPGSPGLYTSESGFLSYYEICMRIDNGTCRVTWDNEHRVAYCVDDNLWVGFENVRSVRDKVSFLVREGFGGAMVWAMPLDDFRQVCKSSSRPYPLISTISSLLRESDMGTDCRGPDRHFTTTERTLDLTTFSVMPEYWNGVSDDDYHVSLSHISIPAGHKRPDRYRRVCYYTSWSAGRSGKGRFTPEDIPPDLCTHIIFAFARLSGKDLVLQDQSDGYLIERLNSLKTKNPSLKTLVSVGGLVESSPGFSNMASARRTRRHFGESVVAFLMKYKFDGLDLNWQYPGLRGGKPQDRANYILLLKDLREAFMDGSRLSGEMKKLLLLTASVPAGQQYIDTGYNIPEMARYIDFVSIMTYDFHGPWNNFTGHHSPLLPGLEEIDDPHNLNVVWAANYWVQRGMPRFLINIGLPTYGRTFVRHSSSGDHGIGTAAIGPGPEGPYTNTKGFLAYYEICQYIESGHGQRYWSEEHAVPYYVQDVVWIGYDDPYSIYKKVQFIVEQGFGGAMVWTLDMDDFNQTCKNSKTTFPLISTMAAVFYQMEKNKTIDGKMIPTIAPSHNPLPMGTTMITQINTENVVQISETNPFSDTPSKVSICSRRNNGIYPDQENCRGFYKCVHGKRYKFSCPSGLHFNSELNVCDWPEHVTCFTGK
ncbi:hypothetical protein CHS0354_031359 [Potamilus streckersoni]|uniref:Acidic mammalian chitinase n=1 Tax=Potamilus streckersoni TaxID=2493646 RepID=A0AAE0SJV4_9BIVA|nr:hypothetical protein CHS0354_031359 [Potamilus streckersoni]